MAQQKTKRRSRKARAARRAAAPAALQATADTSQAPTKPTPRVTPKVAPGAKPVGTRRQQREARERLVVAQGAASGRRLGTYGQRPRSIFHPIPVSEVAILAGLVGVMVGVIDRGNPSLWVGAIVCALGVFEVTAREHLSGFRSHTTLLAAFPAVVVEVILAVEVGVPTKRVLLLLPVIPIFALSFWILHRAFRNARHARVVRSPAP
jgi:hypothetical protein